MVRAAIEAWHVDAKLQADTNLDVLLGLARAGCGVGEATDHRRKLVEILLLHSITVASPHRIATFILNQVLPSPCLVFFVRRPLCAGFGGFAGFCKKLHTWKTRVLKESLCFIDSGWGRAKTLPA
jgi:hypothetical protein